MQYFSRSGNKYASPLVSHYITDNELSESSKDSIIDAMYDMYSQNWDALWKAVISEYSPLENYDRTAEITENNTLGNNRTVNYEHTDTDTGTLKKDSTSTDTGMLKTDNTGAIDTASNIYAFDSTSATPSNTATNTTTGSSTDTHDLTTTIADTDTHNLTFKRSSTETVGDNTTEDNTHNEHVHGNIGVTTSQQMLMSEYELRECYKFYEQIFKDIDKCLTLAIY